LGTPSEIGNTVFSFYSSPFFRKEIGLQEPGEWFSGLFGYRRLRGSIRLMHT